MSYLFLLYIYMLFTNTTAHKQEWNLISSKMSNSFRAPANREGYIILNNLLLLALIMQQFVPAEASTMRLSSPAPRKFNFLICRTPQQRIPIYTHQARRASLHNFSGVALLNFLSGKVCVSNLAKASTIPVYILQEFCS